MADKLTVKDGKRLSFYYRKIARSGNSRYLSIGSIVPKDWDMVKVFVAWEDKKVIVLKLELVQ